MVSDPLPVPDLPPRVLIDYATRCNLRCPMCPVWGSDDEGAIANVKGIMDVENSRKILDELMAAHPLVQPCLYGEPLLIPDLKERIRDLKSRGMTISLNTNALTLNDRVAHMLIDEGVDAIMVSIDAVTPETLQAVRGINLLDKIETAVSRLMTLRDDRALPRIGVSMTVQDANRNEEEAFIARWAGVVDVVRIGRIFENGTFTGMEVPAERKPCPVLYDTLPIRNDGTAAMCCLDGMGATDMGNVFEDGIKAVWHGKAFTEARRAHESGDWDGVPFCKSCNGWARYDYQEEIRDNLLIRRSPIYDYYNRLDRLANWTGNLLGSHPAPA